MIPGLEAKIPHISWPKNQNLKQKQYYIKFNKDFNKNQPHKKIFLKNVYDKHSKSKSKWNYMFTNSFHRALYIYINFSSGTVSFLDSYGQA